MKTGKKEFNPIRSLVLIRIPKISKKTESGIIKSDAMIKEERMSFDGTVDVVAIGPDCKYVCVGNKCTIQQNSILHPVEHLGEELWVIEEYSILGYY